jgi:hypothetical protein
MLIKNLKNKNIKPQKTLKRKNIGMTIYYSKLSIKIAYKLSTIIIYNFKL